MMHLIVPELILVEWHYQPGQLFEVHIPCLQILTSLQTQPGGSCLPLQEGGSCSSRARELDWP